MKKPDKKGASSALATFALVVIMIVAVVGVGYLFYSNGVFGQHQLNINPSAGIQNAASSTGCSVALSTTQTPIIATTDADTNTILSPGVTLYADTVKGVLAPSNTVTNPGQGYAALVNKTGYFGAVIPFTTPCTSAGPQYAGVQKAVDTSISMSVYNSDHRTANSVAANQTVGASNTASIELDLAPSAIHKHLGGAPNNQFTVYFNASNTTNWDPSSMSGISTDGFANCAQNTAATTPSAMGGVLVASWTCTGDFTGKDTNTYKINVPIAGSASYSTAGTVGSLCVVGNDYYANSVANSLGAANAVLSGPVKNTGAAIQSLQCVPVYLK